MCLIHVCVNNHIIIVSITKNMQNYLHYVRLGRYIVHDIQNKKMQWDLGPPFDLGIKHFIRLASLSVTAASSCQLHNLMQFYTN